MSTLSPTAKKICRLTGKAISSLIALSLQAAIMAVVFSYVTHLLKR